MYLPAAFREDDLATLQGIIRAHPLATLVTAGADGLTANHVPMLLDPEPAPLGTLRGHLARANPQLATAGSDALVIFHGPQAYVTPSWYESKREHGKVVPTWNFVAVHAYGVLKTFDDPQRLHALVSALTEGQEQGFAQPWHVTDAPDDFVERQLTAIVGIEVSIARLEGKRKLSQNRPEKDRAGVEIGLVERGDADSAAVAEEMRRKR
ncbi:MAG TPA: FMN-binding negative transcriptional regulator [Pelomicrobium sp.]|nr:FMN-binding negative transcriptional regulator [Pelomicrobium sp.]